VDKELLKTQTLEFYAFQLQELLFLKLSHKKVRKQIEDNYQKSLSDLSVKEKQLESSIRIIQQKIQKEIDVGQKSDTMDE
jgi:hypothetical protein